MGAELNFLNIGLGIAVCVGIFGWMYYLATRSHAQGKPQLDSKKVIRQPWGGDKTGGRGNR